MPIDGNAIDQSGNNVLTVVNGPTLTEDRFGNPNSAYKFDGRDDYINLNNDTPLITAKTFTILLWAKITGTNNSDYGNHSFFEQRDDDASSTAKSTIHYNIYPKERNDSPEDRLRVVLRTSTSPDGLVDINEVDVPDINNWHHYAVRLDAERNVDLFVDGEKMYSGILTETGDFITSVDHVNLGIHTFSNAIKAALDGILDDVYIYNRALSDCEIKIISLGDYEEER